MTPSKLHERLAFAAVAAASGQTGLMVLLGLLREAAWLYSAAALAGVGAALAGITLIHAVLRRQAAEEERDRDRDAEPQALFSTDAGARVKGRNLQQFERFLLPAAAGLLALTEFTLGFFFFRRLGAPPAAAAGSARTIAATVLIGAVVLYLLGSYLAGLAFRGRIAVLRAAAGELIGLAWISAGAGVVALLSLTELPNWTMVYGRIIAVLLMLRGIEKILGVVLEIYRPRRRQQEEHLVYESRLNGLVAQPRSLAANLAETLNYQFGINLSETGFQALAWMAAVTVLFHVVVLGLLSCLVFVNVGEQVVVERWGQPRPGVLNPGLHIKLPWPVDQAYRRPVDQLQQLVIGPAESEKSLTRLWTDDDADTLEPYLTASAPDTQDSETPAPTAETAFSLINLSAVIQFQIADLHRYLYASSEPQPQLERIARRELVRYLAGRDFFEILRADRDELNATFKQQLQAAVDARGLGIEIRYAGVRRLQPPAAVVEAFQDVIAGGEGRKRQELIARGTRSQLLTEAGTNRDQIVSEATSYRDRRIKLAEAEARSYHQLLDLYSANREIYRARAYLDRIEKLKDVRKLVLATDLEDQVIQIDLKKSKSDLFEFTEGK